MLEESNDSQPFRVFRCGWYRSGYPHLYYAYHTLRNNPRPTTSRQLAHRTPVLYFARLRKRKISGAQRPAAPAAPAPPSSLLSGEYFAIFGVRVSRVQPPKVRLFAICRSRPGMRRVVTLVWPGTRPSSGRYSLCAPVVGGEEAKAARKQRLAVLGPVLPPGVSLQKN